MPIVSLSEAAVTGSASGRTTLLGISTPLVGVSIATDMAGPVIAIVTIRAGTLMADLATGAVVRGNGSSLLWINGTVAQVNAKLATLTYTGTSAGSDDLSIVVLAANGALIPALRTTITVVPLASTPAEQPNLVYVNAGTLTLESRTLDGPILLLHEPAGSTSSTTCLLINSTIGPHSAVSVRSDNPIGGVSPRIAIAGRVELNGTMTAAGHGTVISLARGATFVNEGSMAIDAHAAQFTGTGTLINNGRIVVTGDGVSGAVPQFDASIAGNGMIALVGGATAEIGASVGASETIWLGTGANILHLTQPGTFAGSIGGFSVGDRLVLDGVAVTSVLASRTSGSDGAVITLFDGASVIGTLRFSVVEPGTAFRYSLDAAGTATLTVVPVAIGAVPASVNVFRFFDAAHGTQLLTQDPTERDAIISGRPELHYEGVGLHALDPAQSDADATAIYRFFDTGSGTHFMTASTGERDSLLASRPDLVFEPGSTLLEHATAQAGDAAVYRFFDQSSGAHFFTADAGERATILSTRSDMASEGIAFYAPRT